MDELYERPREKLRDKGVAALSTVELFQVVIGSGTARVSGAKIARKAAALLEAGTYSYTSLLALVGLGEAKVSLLLAAVELGKRASSPQPQVSHSEAVVRAIRQQLTKRKTLYTVVYDGARQLVSISELVLEDKVSIAKVVRAVLSSALDQSARSIYVYIGSNNKLKPLDGTDSTRLRAISEALTNIQLQLNGALLIDPTTTQEIQKANW